MCGMDEIRGKSGGSGARGAEEVETSRYETEDGPYNPSAAEAACAWLARANPVRVRRPLRRGQRGPQKAPTKKLVSLRLSREVIEYYRAGGPGWQRRMDEALREGIRLQKCPKLIYRKPSSSDE